MKGKLAKKRFLSMQPDFGYLNAGASRRRLGNLARAWARRSCCLFCWRSSSSPPSCLTATRRSSPWTASATAARRNLAPFQYSPLGTEAIARGETVFPHIFGTDELCRDYFVRVMYGARVSLLTGVFATLVVLVIGAVYGAIGRLRGRTGRSSDDARGGSDLRPAGHADGDPLFRGAGRRADGRARRPQRWRNWAATFCPCSSSSGRCTGWAWRGWCARGCCP